MRVLAALSGGVDSSVCEGEHTTENQSQTKKKE